MLEDEAIKNAERRNNWPSTELSRGASCLRVSKRQTLYKRSQGV